MRARTSFGLALLLLAGPPPAFAQAPPSDREGIEFFETRIRPVLVEHCFKCHSGKKTKADLLLDSRPAMLKGTDNASAILPGAAATSLLLKALLSAGANRRMAPTGQQQAPLI